MDRFATSDGKGIYYDNDRRKRSWKQTFEYGEQAFAEGFAVCLVWLYYNVIILFELFSSGDS